MFEKSLVFLESISNLECKSEIWILGRPYCTWFLKSGKILKSMEIRNFFKNMFLKNKNLIDNAYI